MAKIINKINDQLSKSPQEPFFSLEFFPPKTIAGVENLYTRMERMATLNPLFIDITWSAGGSGVEDLATSIAEHVQKYISVDVLLHLSCTNLTKDMLRVILTKAKNLGIKNILALRGDPPKGALVWEPIEGGCNNAKELVSFIRSEFGDYFGIAVAGFPEGHPDGRTHGEDFKLYIQRLKEKVDAGADFILT